MLTLRRGAGETIRALNGKDYTVDPEDCAICDDAGVQSIAGVIGGEATGCDETTRTVFVECALFDPVRIALTGRRHQIVSDARQRFERGLDPALMPDAIEAATAMILELCGGEPGPVTAAGAEPAWQRDATMRFSRIAGLGGSHIDADEAVASLERLGFGVRHRDAEKVTVAVPSWRNDVAAPVVLDLSPSLSPEIVARVTEGCAEIEPECDLIEEVLRLKGLDAVPPVSLPRMAPVPLATLYAEAAAHRPRPPHAGGAGPGRVRDVQLHGHRRRGAVRRHARRTAPVQPDRRRPGPVASDRRSRRWLWPRNATPPAVIRISRCSRSGRRSAPTPLTANTSSPPASAPAPPAAPGLVRCVASMRWTPRPICGPC